MSHLVPAAVQLIREVQHLRPDATVKSVGPQDGIGFLRTITFDATTSKWLLPMLEAIEDDRLAEVLNQKGKPALITFVADTRADHETPYNLDTVEEIIHGG